MNRLKATVLVSVASLAAQTTSTQTSGEKAGLFAFDPRDPITCISAQRAGAPYAKLYVEGDPKNPTTTFYSCDRGITLHALIIWRKDGKPLIAATMGVVDTIDDIKRLGKQEAERHNTGWARQCEDGTPSTHSIEQTSTDVCQIFCGKKVYCGSWFYKLRSQYQARFERVKH